MTAAPRGLIEMAFRFRYGGKVQSNTFHFVPPDTAWGLAELRSLQLVLGEWWESGDFINLAPSSFQTEAVNLVEQSFRYFTPVGPPFLRLVEVLAKAVVGSGVGPGVPADSSVRLRFDTVGPFGRASGGLHFVGISTDYLEGLQQDQVQGVWADSMVSTFQGLPAFLLDAFAPSPAPIWVVWLQRRQVGGPLAMPVVQPVTRVTMPSRQLGSMRLRLRGQRKYLAGRT